MASREAYVPPTQQSSSGNAGNTGNTGTSGTAFNTATNADDGGPATQYICGECNQKVQLKKGDPIRCKECGHRVLYKERTKRSAYFQ